MMNVADPRCVVAFDSPLTREELLNRDDHAENVWRLVVDMCSSKRMAMPRRSSTSYDDLCKYSPTFAPYQPRICVFTSEVDPHQFNCEQKTKRVVLDKLPYSKHSITSKLLTLLRRKLSGSDTDDESEDFSIDTDRSPSPVSVPAEPTPSGSHSLAVYASNEPSAWKKVQAYVQKNDKCSIEDCNGRFRKAKSSPSPRSKSEEPAWDRVRNFVFKSDFGPDKAQRRHSDDDFSKSFNEYFNCPASASDLQPSPEGSLQSSPYLASSILPPADQGAKNLAVVSDLFASNEKEDLEEEFNSVVMGKKRVRDQKTGVISKSRHLPLISSVRSLLERLRRRQGKPKPHQNQLQYDEEPSLTPSRSLSIDVAHADILNTPTL